MIVPILIATIYAVGVIVGYRKGYVYGYEAAVKEWPSLGHAHYHGNGLFFGALCGVLWPAAVPIWVFTHWVTPVPPTEQRRRLREREEHIARIERELGIHVHREDHGPYDD